MAYNSFQNILALELVEQTSNAYSFDRYGRKQWFLIARFLISENYAKEAVVRILRSKHMRWAADARNKGTYSEFRRYYLKPYCDNANSKAGKFHIDQMLEGLNLENMYVK